MRSRGIWGAVPIGVLERPGAYFERCPRRRHVGRGPAVATDPTSREFCYLGRTKAAVYHDETVRELSERTDRRAPAWFSYDIGPGYHASVRPGRTAFLRGRSMELLILSQIASFFTRIANVYPPGARFWLVIDNLCALRTNDIATEATEGYCANSGS